ncbi:unnamed protein product [Taenia asiatica]|uniref:Uncharacterized protein n=1 Tax=Taenia asiatica TaxID=60517 RepID=A0A0R3VTK3_TAEAS|nr:unnamed protein product [Taenia asiatica]
MVACFLQAASRTGILRFPHSPSGYAPHRSSLSIAHLIRKYLPSPSLLPPPPHPLSSLPVAVGEPNPCPPPPLQTDADPVGTYCVRVSLGARCAHPKGW